MPSQRRRRQPRPKRKRLVKTYIPFAREELDKIAQWGAVNFFPTVGQTIRVLVNRALQAADSASR
jgi:hypothetical protein